MVSTLACKLEHTGFQIRTCTQFNLWWGSYFT